MFTIGTRRLQHRPQHPRHAAQRRAADPGIQIASDRRAGSAMARILIVDDDAAVRGAYALALERDGHDARVAASAEDALKAIRLAVPEAILLDLKMPFISGFGFLYRLREICPRVPVGIITGMTDLDDTTREEIRNLSAELWHKPLAMADLQAVARHLLTRASSESPSVLVDPRR
jgi:DNA-binding NtrC family response regulator